MKKYLTKSLSGPHESRDNGNPNRRKENADIITSSTTKSFTADMLKPDDYFTFDVRLKRKNIKCLFPPFKNEATNCNTIIKNWETTDKSNKKPQTINSLTSTSFYDSPTTASSISSSSTSSSSTIHHSLHSGMSRHNFRVANPLSIPDYANLQKYLSKFHSRSKKRKSDILKNHLMPWLGKNSMNVALRAREELAETGFWGLKNVIKENKKLQFGRSILLKWWRVLLNNMSIIEVEDRSIYYECILDIMSRCEFIEYDFVGSPTYSQWHKHDKIPHTSSVDDYRNLLSTTLNYAINKLNQKAIYSNMISFCATVLAVSYFKIPGLATLLLQKLTLQPKVMRKLYKEMFSSDHHEAYKIKLQCVFPRFLHPLMTFDISCYQNRMASCKFQDSASPINLSGNWVRRWQSDDSELFFTFYKKYHHVLSRYTSIVYPETSNYQLHQRNAIVINLPGYMYFATFFACKIDALIHRELNSVTTIRCQEQQQIFKKPVSFSPLSISIGDSIAVIDEAKLFMPSHENSYDDYSLSDKAYQSILTGKPKALIMATKRYAECIIWCISEANHQGLYLDMLNVWLRFSVKRTILTEAGEVYCMIDFLEQVVLELQSHSLKGNRYPVDIPFILHTLDIILSRSDHTTSLLRALTFIYTHFGFLTSHAALLDLLCNQIMLDTQNFERLLLHWAKNVRHFFFRCLVWRIGRVWQSAGVRWNNETEQLMQAITPKNDSNICDGNTCWIEWERIFNSGVMESEIESDVMTSESLAYQKCSLEIHIRLESLMVSMLQQHSSLQQEYKNRSFCSELSIPAPVIDDEGKCLTPIPERIRKFSSQLASPPAKAIDKKSFPFPKKSLTCNYHRDLDSYCNNSKSNFSHKEYKVSPMTMTIKKRIVIKSRNSKDMLLKLFNNSPTEDYSTKSDNSTEFSVNHNDDDDGKEKMLCSEYYTVSSPYSCIPSSYFAPAERQSNEIDRIANNQDTKKGSSIRCDDNDSSRKEGYVNSSSTENHTLKTPDGITSPHNWKYHTSNHVYAVKVVSEIMTPTLREYFTWVTDTNRKGPYLSAVYIPRLAIEWPKNWSYSQI